ncbi:MAG: hypothetical protein V9G63_04275 [Candidatus Competibacter sp.]
MSFKSRSLFSKALLAAAIVASLGGMNIVQAADVGAATGAQLPKAPPPLVPTTPVKPMAVPASPVKSMTAPAAASPAQATPKVAPVAGMASAGVAGNSDGSCPEAAPIKGARSKIYHAPGGRSYAKTKAKVCFASAEAAEQSGYRAPKK